MILIPQETKREYIFSLITKVNKRVKDQIINSQKYELSDYDIIIQVNNGNIEAFGVLVNRYKNRLMNYVYRFSHNYNISQDIVEETFLRVLRKSNRFNSTDNMCIMLFTITSRLINDMHWQRKRRYRNNSVNNSDVVYANHDMANGYISDTTTQMAFDFLQPHLREVIILRDIVGFNYTEIATITHVPIKTVKNRVNEARWKLSGYLS